MKTHKYRYIVVLLAVTIISATKVFSQETYLLKEFRIPEITQDNPGAYIPYDAHVAFPGLGRIHVGVNSPFNLYDAYNVTDKVLKNSPKHVSFQVGAQITPIHFGFRVKKRNYFSITTAVKADAYFATQKDLVKLLVQGNTGDNKQLTFFKDNTLCANAYAEIGLGYNREINDNVSFGINAKYLMGLLNAHTSKADVTLETVANEAPNNNGYNYHELIMRYGLEGKFASVYDLGQHIDSTLPKSEFNSLTAADFFKNHGFSFDLGARYRINRFLEIEAAVLDIGFINWTTNTYQYDIKDADYTFLGYVTSGGEIIENMDNGGSLSTFVGDIESYFSKIGDSLQTVFVNELQTSTSYRKWLNTKFNVGLSFYASEHDKFNASFHGIFINKVFLPSGSISYRRTVKRWLDVVIGNTFLHEKSLLNPGAGLNFTLGVFQLYIMADYMNTLAYIDKAKNLNVVFGINFIAHRKEDTFKASYPY